MMVEEEKKFMKRLNLQENIDDWRGTGQHLISCISESNEILLFAL